MLFYTGLFFLVIAVSLDGFGVGITYGMRRINVPIIALLIIMLCSGVVVLSSMTIGNVLTTFISPETSQILGGSILIAIGLFSLVNSIRAKLVEQKSQKKQPETNRLHDFKTVMTTPDKADLDRSGTISAGEALLLGLALALDAFGAGIGASMIGYSPVLTAFLIACMSGLFLFLGMKIGMLLSQYRKLQNFSFLPPVLLIGLGILNLF